MEQKKTDILCKQCGKPLTAETDGDYTFYCEECDNLVAWMDAEEMVGIHTDKALKKLDLENKSQVNNPNSVIETTNHF